MSNPTGLRDLSRRLRVVYRDRLADTVDRVFSLRDAGDFRDVFDAVHPVLSWDHAPTARRLYTLAREGPGKGAIVEIGSFLGNSTIYLARGSMAAGREAVTAVDPHSESSMSQVPGEDTTSEQFEANLHRFGVAGHVRYLRQTSAQAASDWAGEPIRLLFIDGLHTYTAVMQDYLGWAPFLGADHVVVFDDHLWPEVWRAVTDLSRMVRPQWFARRGGQAIFSTGRIPLRAAGLP